MERHGQNIYATIKHLVHVALYTSIDVMLSAVMSTWPSLIWAQIDWGR